MLDILKVMWEALGPGSSFLVPGCLCALLSCNWDRLTGLCRGQPLDLGKKAPYLLPPLPSLGLNCPLPGSGSELISGMGQVADPR